MRYLLFLCVAPFLMLAGCNSQPVASVSVVNSGPQSPTALKSAYQKAVESKDVRAIRKLFFTEGADRTSLSWLEMDEKADIARSVASIELKSSDSVGETKIDYHDQVYQLTLEPKGAMIVKFKSFGNSKTKNGASVPSTYLYGEKDGIFYLLGYKRTR